jgi:hypothetical protein
MGALPGESLGPHNARCLTPIRPPALAAGGRDNGAPGPRPHYHEDYYGAFVLDLDGHNVEAVCHERPRP